MIDIDDQELMKAIADIRRYLKRHPNAMDTLEGITSWWIPRQRYEAECEKVVKALAYLENCGEVNRREMPDGRSLFLKTKESQRTSEKLGSTEDLD